MKDSEISTPEQLDAALLQNTLDKHRKLWKLAEGRISWTGALGMVMAAALLVLGLFMDDESQGDRVFRVGLGVLLVLQFQIYWALAKGEAVAELLKRLEQRVTRLEKKTFAQD